MGEYVVWWWLPNRGEPSVNNVAGLGEALAAKRQLMQAGAEVALVIGPGGRCHDCERAGEGATLDEMLGRGRHNTPTDPAA